MTALFQILLIGAFVAWAINNNKQQRKIMSKVSDLAATLTAIDTQVVAVAASVAALETALKNVDLPAPAKAALDKLTSDVAGLSAAVNPPPAAQP